MPTFESQQTVKDEQRLSAACEVGAIPLCCFLRMRAPCFSDCVCQHTCATGRALHTGIVMGRVFRIVRAEHTHATGRRALYGETRTQAA